MNKKLISKALSDISGQWIEESLSCPEIQAHPAPERTKNMGKYEQSMPRKGYRRFFATVCAACLVFAMTITAYAANWFGIREMLGSGRMALPEEAEPYIQQHTETAAEEDWSARITESLCDTGKILVTVTVSGGDKYILAPTDGLLTDSAGMITEEDSQKLAEHAKAQGKELLFVGATLMQNEHLGIFTEMQICKRTSDSELTILVESVRSGGVSEGEAICRIYARTADDERMELNVPFDLTQTPASPVGTYVPQNPDAIPGVILGNATVSETPMGLSVRWMETVTDVDAWYEIMKVEVVGVEFKTGGGAVQEDDGNWYFNASAGQGTIGDTMTVNFYDWDKQPIGTIVFEKK